ncbi:MAG: hypothetical protein J3Q66DRAFT_322408 [Benniella sp.]|nr:MAG: hypothetical protein J3Q66DRAFT_322408 [Benniella sp.]
MFSCLTDSASTSIAMPSPSAEVEGSAVSEPSAVEASSMEMLNPLALAASTDFARTEFCSVRNLICATAPRKTLTRWHFEVTSSRCFEGNSRVRSSTSWLMQSRRLRSTRLWVSRRLWSLSRAVRVSRGLRFRILTPARSKDFVVLYVSDEMLPSNRKVLGVGEVEDLEVDELLLPAGVSVLGPLEDAGFAWMDLVAELEVVEAVSPEGL